MAIIVTVYTLAAVGFYHAISSVDGLNDMKDVLCPLFEVIADVYTMSDSLQ
jgi:hypothetical protein